MNREQQRFQAAVAAMQGLLSVPPNKERGDIAQKLMQMLEISSPHQLTAYIAVQSADALLAELDRTKPEPEKTKPDKDGWIPHRPTDQIPTGDFVVKFNDGTVSPDLDWSEQAWLHGYEESAGLNIVAWKPA